MKRSDRIKRKSNKNLKKLFIFAVFLVVIASALLLYINKPALRLVGAQDITLDVNHKFDDPGVELAHNNEKVNKSDLLEKGSVDYQKLGDYELTYDYSAWFMHSSVKRHVKVVDREAPQMKLNGAEIIELTAGTAYEEPGATVSDNYDQEIQKKLQINGNVDTNTPGEYKIAYQVADQSGNKVALQRTVKVVAKKEPESNGSTIYLTFDDGPDADVTPQVLKILEDEKIKATFFVTGNGPDDLILKEHQAGHTIALHTFSHNYAQVYQSVDAYYQDLNQVADRVKRITGVDSKLVRFPGGSSNSISANYCKGIMSTLVKDLPAKGYQFFDWNVSSGDGSNQANSDIPYNAVTTTLKPGQDNVVLMHDTKQTSADALQRIIKFGKENGYTFKALSIDSFAAHHGATN